MKKTKELFMEQRIWEDRLELLPHEEEFIHLERRNNVQNHKRGVRNVLGAPVVPRRANKKS